MSGQVEGVHKPGCNIACEDGVHHFCRTEIEAWYHALVHGTADYAGFTDWLRDHDRALRESIAALTSALERTERNLLLSIHGKPVRDLAENLGENAAARGEQP